MNAPRPINPVSTKVEQASVERQGKQLNRAAGGVEANEKTPGSRAGVWGGG